MPGRSTSIWYWILSNMAATGSNEEEVSSTSFTMRRQRKDDGALGRGDCNGNTSSSKHGRADLARKIDDREEADNSAVGKGRGPRLLRLSRLQGQMRAATSAGCGSGMRQWGRQMMLSTKKGAALMVAAIDTGCCDWGDDKMVRLLMEEKAAGRNGRAMQKSTSATAEAAVTWNGRKRHSYGFDATMKEGRRDQQRKQINREKKRAASMVAAVGKEPLTMGSAGGATETTQVAGPVRDK
ncbi:hypothetical protein BHM03_00038000 [Ensete ventricosum]|nr:hypothetical protein BHM03_00038000 [Ensete ventricosum]